jgi:two-component system capsular synthesis response regulator RcsB
MIKVLIADDHPIVLNGIALYLAEQQDIEVVGKAKNSTELVRLLDTIPCDVIITDYSMPGGQIGDGLPMLKTLRRKYPRTRLVVITMLDNPALIRDMKDLGVSVILNKADRVDYLLPAVWASFRGQNFFPPSVQEILATAGLDRPKLRAQLSQRELEVLRQCAAGAPIVEIARLSNRSSKTVSAQKSVAMKKLGLTNDYELYQYALTHGLIGGAQS